MMIFESEPTVPKKKLWTCCLKPCRLRHTEDVEICTCGHLRCQTCVYDNEAHPSNLVLDEDQSTHCISIQCRIGGTAADLALVHITYGCYHASAINSNQGLATYGDPKYYYCCSCGYGPQSTQLCPRCINCGHTGCSNCEIGY